MTYLAQAGARRVVPLLAVGLGIAVAVMAFAPAAPTPTPGAAVVGIHEANYGTHGEGASPLTYYFRVHTGVRLEDKTEVETVDSLLENSAYGALERHIVDKYWSNILDARARGILEQIDSEREKGEDILKFRLDTRYGCVPGYYFHVYMDFQIERPDFFEIERLLREEDYASVKARVAPPERLAALKGTRAEAILQEVRSFAVVQREE